MAWMAVLLWNILMHFKCEIVEIYYPLIANWHYNNFHVCITSIKSFFCECMSFVFLGFHCFSVLSSFVGIFYSFLASVTVLGIYTCMHSRISPNDTVHCRFVCNNVYENDLYFCVKTLQLRHNEHDGVPNHQPHDCLLNNLFWRRSKKTSKLRVTGLCEGNSPVTVEFPAQRASNVEKVSIWWRHHDLFILLCHNISYNCHNFNTKVSILISVVILRQCTTEVVLLFIIAKSRFVLFD